MVHCFNRHVGKLNKSNIVGPRTNDTIVGTTGRNEIDTMADTSCAGANWTLIEDTGSVCDVYPFQEDYEAAIE